ncbi:SpoVR family protein [Paenibacillus mucilaginosus]|uniref:SpoVR n=3 Tax=Paenibacillus mucilaginosus TaxID=61624 RepID=H6NC92_9BACL|nr:SpoVR family protein [Paenibacillus mucilaginosus]AEI42027.1 SpoVR [Paenibacillus mucilaginosus KNP414]AFC28285.1 SpoVR [Paenibacillus mucilaginosus 3016]AFH60459.1 stage V sporulation protein R [Paenibacillus mucilaginosus K02]MCG7217450.1 SpoVR family protein [Paenibacillus mucilaginosus]WDM28919.1 SpoVR family protein [Paenibacillus mucilaginosus]
MKLDDIKKLEYAIAEITEVATGFGLDFYPMRYEICPAEIIYTFGAYGMPTRFSHWSFGKTFHKMKMQYDFGLSKIYELVINSDPCYAFLLDGNSLIQNKLIVAHVLAHCDFFKNNVRFSKTNRNMVESMSATAERIRQYEIEYGNEEVEKFIDAVLAIQEHVDPLITKPVRGMSGLRTEAAAPPTERTFGYEDLWDLDEKPKPPERKEGPAKFPPRPEKDLMLFIEEYAPYLKDWQRDIMTMLRDEMLYFWPQMETKIMNEGWASYWHQRILRELDLTEDETIEYAKLNSSVVVPSRHSLNPYYLGLKIFEDIEKRWDHPSKEDRERFGYKGGEGRQKIFEVREFDSDSSFIRNYMTKQLVDELDLYVFEKKGPEWKITDKSWENIRDQLIFARVNGGFPYIVVEDGDYERSGELYLRHMFEGTELDLKYVERTIPYIHRLWGKPVYLESVIEGKPVLFSYDGRKHNRKFL